MKNDVKLQILISEELNQKLVNKILKESLTNKSNKIEGISTYVRKLIEHDVEVEKKLEKNNG